MCAAVKRYVWCEQTSCSDCYFTGVDDGAIEVDEHVLPKLDIMTIVNMDWGLNPRMIGEEALVCFFRFCFGR